MAEGKVKHEGGEGWREEGTAKRVGLAVYQCTQVHSIWDESIVGP